MCVCVCVCLCLCVCVCVCVCVCECVCVCVLVYCLYVLADHNIFQLDLCACGRGGVCVEYRIRHRPAGGSFRPLPQWPP